MRGRKRDRRPTENFNQSVYSRGDSKGEIPCPRSLSTTGRLLSPTTEKKFEEVKDKKLKEQFDERQKALEAAGDKFDADAAAFKVPTGSDAKKQATDKLAELTKAALAPISDAEWGKVFESVKVAFAEPTAGDRIDETATLTQRFVDSTPRATP